LGGVRTRSTIPEQTAEELVFDSRKGTFFAISRPGLIMLIVEQALFISSNSRLHSRTACVVKWSEFLATDPEARGSISGATRFYEK
jgi:hypothetical protein